VSGLLARRRLFFPSLAPDQIIVLEVEVILSLSVDLSIVFGVEGENMAFDVVISSVVAAVFKGTGPLVARKIELLLEIGMTFADMAVQVFLLGESIRLFAPLTIWVRTERRLAMVFLVLCQIALPLEGSEVAFLVFAHKRTIRVGAGSGPGRGDGSAWPSLYLERHII
jgi:hypothetical protein